MRLAFFFLLLVANSYAQSVSQKLNIAIDKLEIDSQFKHGIISLYVVDKNGKIIFDKNSNVGLAPASCQKVVTAVTAFELLGKDYSYKTKLGYDGKINDGILSGNIYVAGSGDPTLGSWRYSSTKENIIIAEFKNAIKQNKIQQIKGIVLGDDRIWGTQRVPDGWIWQDVGNYYGAGASGLNWRENQYDLILKSGNNFGDAVQIKSTHPKFLPGIHLINEVTSAAKGSGDNTYIYLAADADVGFVRGTIPVNEDSFVVSGSLPDGGKLLAATIYQSISGGKAYPDNNVNYLKEKSKWNKADSIFYMHTSPPLDSIMYWFLKKSINLYGEALLKTIGYEKTKTGTTDAGVKIIKNFWSERGIERSSLKIIDGSGLSPGNRVTTKALVSVMQYAKDKPWFSSFYYDLPEANGIKMKDGYINGVRSYTGYIKSKPGEEYTFSFIVNNFDGSASTVREKMWKVLDILK
ncbi:MAG: D-alanyl-D-alanine carboxypeptidase/D-alanyl-D-alanine-endopeptidase [Bacteroidota bacterium]|nr:D-alanyl-D-alanine carboxypeptidase/D-alanyl-D-alanine-endopeptidase [Bacteroidota bacterium]